VALAAAVGGSVTAVLAERWRYGLATPVMATVQLPACRDHPALEWEVASPLVSRSW
jgi:hypothetical protein